MLRFVHTDSQVKADPRQVLPGRGAYVHLREVCLARTVKRGGLQRALKISAATAIQSDLEGFLSQAQGK